MGKLKISQEEIFQKLLEIQDAQGKMQGEIDSLKPKPRELPPMEPSVTPIPPDYREIVDNVLNRSFGIQIEPHTDRPSFTFTIVVPEKYSNMTPAQREMNKYDVRPRVINYSEGSNGVREWSLKVFENLSNETKAMVVADRSLLQ